MKSSFSLDEEERRLLLLGLAIMVRERPGFECAASNAAQTLSGAELFDEFRRCNPPQTGGERTQERLPG